ncbi:Helitron helicase [Phytophthora megakarya]|uniref:Helitron helicase n=1 Tax=Phytophthora megakarya TaxID=4795 RepID=A0A225WA55_9STRA|nr:Helitron helicase [Phytophthora megakarya]
MVTVQKVCGFVDAAGTRFPARSGVILPSNSAVSSSITQGSRRHSYAGNLENDREWEECLAEAVLFKMLYTLRQHFGTILVYSQFDYASAL